MMYTIGKQIHFCYGHRLQDYDGPCKNLHGHNGKVEILLSSQKLDPRDILVDFSDVKKRVKTWIDQTLDHRLLLRKDDPLIPVLEKLNEPFFVMDKNPTAEAIAALIFDYCKNAQLPVSEVRLWETESAWASARG